MSVSTYIKSNSVKLSENFSSHEFNCHGGACCSQTLIDPKLTAILQQIRTHFDAKVTVTSGYRCARHNSSVSKSTASYHTKGMAADISVEGVLPREVAKYAESIGVLGIGLYETDADGYFVHVDTRTNKYFWYGQSQLYRSTFGGASNQTTTSPSTNVQADTSQNQTYVLMRGVIGSQVKSIQEKLIAIGYDLGKDGADGNFGKMTDAAVRNFQKANGLVVDGKVGEKTLEALDKAYANRGELKSVKITASVLNVREGAGLNYRVVGRVKRDSVHNLFEEKNGWGRIANGWISSSYYKKL